MKNKKELILTTLICLLPIAAGLMLYAKLPDTIATHFDMNGEPDGWSSKPFAVFGIPAIIAGLNLICQFAMRTDPKKENMSVALRAITVWIPPALSLLIQPLVLSYALGYKSRIEVIVPLLVSLLFIVIGNYLPKTKQSYTMGIKLPWTLASEENWNRTHRFAGPLWMVSGIAMALLNLLRLWQFWIMPLFITLTVLAPTLYSYSLYKKGI